MLSWRFEWIFDDVCSTYVSYIQNVSMTLLFCFSCGNSGVPQGSIQYALLNVY